ncbi:hypothetical protein SVIOM74S_07426 [Streptomyces violarus]
MLGCPPRTTSPTCWTDARGRIGEVVLRRHDDRLEIIANGCFLMDTSDGRSERRLVDAALDALAGRRDRPDVLIGGLGRRLLPRPRGRGPALGRDHGRGTRARHRRMASRRPAAPRSPPRPSPIPARKSSKPISWPTSHETSDTLRRACASTSTTDPAGPSRRATEISTEQAGLAQLRTGVEARWSARRLVRRALARNSKKPCGMSGSSRCVPKRSRLPGAFRTSCTSATALDSKGVLLPVRCSALTPIIQASIATMRRPRDHPTDPGKHTPGAGDGADTHLPQRFGDGYPGRTAPGSRRRGRRHDRGRHRDPPASARDSSCKQRVTVRPPSTRPRPGSPTC